MGGDRPRNHITARFIVVCCKAESCFKYYLLDHEGKLVLNNGVPELVKVVPMTGNIPPSVSASYPPSPIPEPVSSILPPESPQSPKIEPVELNFSEAPLHPMVNDGVNEETVSLGESWFKEAVTDTKPCDSGWDSLMPFLSYDPWENGFNFFNF
jgi:hypothetical protein